MPVILQGERICEKCGRKFDWVYFVNTKAKLHSCSARMEDIPQLPMAYRVETEENGTHRVYVNCPHCDYENRFIHDND